MANSPQRTDVPNTEFNEAAKVDQADFDVAHGEQFLNRWNRLVSTTNWEKGRIICDWRDALMAEGAPVTSYSDEAWAQLVGGVTSQHVGRLRRVFQRFGDVADEYDGLYWSHFQAAIDWDDAEMWLEGAIRNGFSVSQMRGKRWETLGHDGAPPSTEDEIDESSEEYGAVDDDPPLTGEATPANREASNVAVDSIETDESASSDAESSDAGDISEATPSTSAVAAAPRNRIGIEVDELPEDLAEAFEQFKLAIIAHRCADWANTSPEAVLECLDALKDLALSPAE